MKVCRTRSFPIEFLELAIAFEVAERLSLLQRAYLRMCNNVMMKIMYLLWAKKNSYCQAITYYITRHLKKIFKVTV